MPKVIIVNDASVARGGATGLSLLQARLLRARGIETVFFAADREANVDLRDLGVRLYNAGSDPLMTAHPLRAATQGLYNPAVRRKLADVIAVEDTSDTVYHVHSWSKALTPSAFAALRPVARRVFIHAHDFFLACPNGGFMDYGAMNPCARVPLSFDCLRTQCDKRSYAQKLWRVTRQGVLRRTLPRDLPWGGVLMIHPAMARYFEMSGYPPALLHPLRNPASALCDTRVRAEDNTGVLFIGRVEAEKGVEDLIAAAQAAAVPLTVIGEGPLRPSLAAQYPDVRFLGWMERDQIATEAALARVLVMPSRYPEPFGLVAAEASLSGLPVIVSDSALLAEEIVAHGVGFACNTRDRAGFAALLRQVADMSSDQISAISLRGATGAAGLCTTPEAWIIAQLDHYNRVLSAA